MVLGGVLKRMGVKLSKIKRVCMKEQQVRLYTVRDNQNMIW